MVTSPARETTQISGAALVLAEAEWANPQESAVKALKKIVGPCGLEPQTSTVSKGAIMYA